jgi:hypothetical protein
MTIAQLSRGVPVDLTEMFLQMATGKFDLSGLIRLLSAAAEREFSASAARDVSIGEGYGGKYAKYGGKFGKYGGMYDKAPDRAKPAEDQMRWDELRMERLRDSYMFHKILEAKKAGYRLAGLGDAHRENLEGLLKNDSEILVKQSPAFYLAQYRDHPDRD